MNVLLVNKFYYLRGGAERSFFETQRMLEAAGHRVVPFAMKDDRNRPTRYARYFVDHVEFNKEQTFREKIEIIPRVIYFRQARKRLEGLLRKERLDLAHLHNIAHQISPSILYSLNKFGIPVVQTLHDYKLICPTYTMLSNGEVCERCAGGRYYHAIRQRCNKGSFSASLLNAVEMYAHRALGIYARGVDLYISPSRFLRNKLLQAGRLRTSIRYLPNAIDTDRYRPEYGGQRYCVYFGRLSPEKDVQTLIRAMRGIDRLKLVVIGDGLQRRELEDLSRREGLDSVSFLGALYGEDLHKIVRKSLFAVLPSRCYENCPFSILEAFALGKPVIGADIGGIPELIDPGRDGLLFRPGDEEDLREQIGRLAGDEPGTIDMGHQARRKVEQLYSYETHSRQLIDIYHQVLEGSGSERSASSRSGQRAA